MWSNTETKEPYRKDSIKLICIMCKKPIEKSQERNGKAICKECEQTTFPQRLTALSEDPYYWGHPQTKRQKKEQEIFLKMMTRAFNRFF